LEPSVDSHGVSWQDHAMRDHDSDPVFAWFSIWHWAKRGGRMPDVTKIPPSQRPTMPRAGQRRTQRGPLIS
jgi:hypothetical protein